MQRKSSTRPASSNRFTGRRLPRYSVSALVELCKCEGQTVKAGEVLARLDDGEERALLTELQARLSRLRADSERIRKLVERNVTSRLTYDEKLTQIREYEARVGCAEGSHQ